MVNMPEKYVDLDESGKIPRGGVIQDVVVLAEVNGYNTPYYVRGTYTSFYRAKKAAKLFYRYLPEFKEEWVSTEPRTKVNKSLPYFELHMVETRLDRTYYKQKNTIKEALKNVNRVTNISDGSGKIQTTDAEGGSSSSEESS
jgi:hypothetical protein